MPSGRRRLRVDDFDYELPAEAIAQTPAEPRDASRLLVLDRARQRRRRIEHARFRDIGRWLRPGDLLVVNDSRVIPARLRGTRAGGGAAEVLVLRPLADATGPLGGARPALAAARASATCVDAAPAATASRWGSGVGRRHARGPLRPRSARGHGRGRRDAAAAVHPRPLDAVRSATRPCTPTAGLGGGADRRACTSRPSCSTRWRPAASRGSVTLHVGLDTFRPLEGEFVDEHRIHREWYEVPPATRRARSSAARGAWSAVGTTAVRVLETARVDGAAIGLDRPLHHAAASVRGGRRADHELPPAAQLAAAARHGLRAGRHGRRATPYRGAGHAARRPIARRWTSGLPVLQLRRRDADR